MGLIYWAKWDISKHYWSVVIERNTSRSEWNGWLAAENTPISPLQETFSNESALILLYHCSFSSPLSYSFYPAETGGTSGREKPVRGGEVR